MQNVKEKFSGPFGGKVHHKFLIKFAAVFALFAALDPVLARIRLALLAGHLLALRTGIDLRAGSIASFIHSQEIFAGA